MYFSGEENRQANHGDRNRNWSMPPFSLFFWVGRADEMDKNNEPFTAYRNLLRHRRENIKALSAISWRVSETVIVSFSGQQDFR